jgi:hypothetical protein
MSNDKVHNAELAAVWTPPEEQAPHGATYMRQMLSNNPLLEYGPFTGSRPEQPGKSEFPISPAKLPSKDDVIGGKRRGDHPPPLPSRPRLHDERSSPSLRNSPDGTSSGRRFSNPRGERENKIQQTLATPRHTIASPFAGNKYLEDGDDESYDESYDESQVAITTRTKNKYDGHDSELGNLESLFQTIGTNETKKPELRLGADKPKPKKSSGISWRAFTEGRADQRSAEIAQLQASLRKRGNSISFSSHAVADDGERFPLFTSRDHPKQQRKLSGLRARSPPRKVASNREDGPDDPVLPRATSAHPHAGLRVKPKTHSMSTSTLDHKLPQPQAILAADSDDELERFLRQTGCYVPHVQSRVDSVEDTVAEWQALPNASDSDQKQTDVYKEVRDALNNTLSMFPRPPRVSSSSQSSIKPVGLSEATADSASEMMTRESIDTHTIGSKALDEADSLDAEESAEDLSPSVPPPAPSTDIPIFAQARRDLQRLQAAIGDLSDSSDDTPEAAASDLEAMRLSISDETHTNHTTTNVREEADAVKGNVNDLPTRTGESASTSRGSPAHKRAQLDDTNEEHARTEVGMSRKRTKLSSLRFICCFHNGPGRKCSGTDDSISEVLKKLSEQHDTQVCDRCWVLKIKDDSSGLFVHPNDDQACLDHCLSPQCHKTTPTTGHRHLFDQNTCGTKTSRVRPGDSKAVYRFIFQLVHAELDPPSTVLTAEHSLHLDAVPRLSRRKLNREELTARADDLEKRLECGEQQNLTNTIRIMQLEQQLADAHRATGAAEEKNAALEKQSRRIIAMLSDALRTGVFPDSLAHQSLLRRVEEDAPGALVHQSQSLPMPSGLDQSRNSSATPMRDDVVGQDPLPRPATYKGFTGVAPLPLLRDQTADEYMSGAWSGDPSMGCGWLSIFDEPENGNFIPPQI